MELSLPRVDAVGFYKMTGTVPPNLDLGSSEGDERFSWFSQQILFLFLFTANSTVVAGESGSAVLDLICLCLPLFTPLFCGLVLYIFACVIHTLCMSSMSCENYL